MYLKFYFHATVLNFHTIPMEQIEADIVPVILQKWNQKKKKKMRKDFYLKSSTRSIVEWSVFPVPWNSILVQYHAFDCTKHIRGYKLACAQLNALPRVQLCATP